MSVEDMWFLLGGIRCHLHVGTCGSLSSGRCLLKTGGLCWEGSGVIYNQVLVA